jgi:hypothetical protein
MLSARTIWFGFEYSAYIMASIVAVSFKFDKAQYTKILTMLSLVNLLLMSYEYLYQEYLYVYVASDGSILDEVLFGGHAEIFRAKGLFAGPLSAVAFAYVLLVIRRFDLYSFLIVLFTGLLTYGRLAILVGIIGVLLKLKFRQQVFGLSLLLIGLVLKRWDFQFMFSAFDLYSANNIGRYQAWLDILTQIEKFKWYEWLLGSSKLLQRDIAVESDWLRILFTGGISLIIVYLALLYKLVSRKIEYFLIVLIMCIFPFAQSLLISVLILNMSFYNVDKNYRLS